MNCSSDRTNISQPFRFIREPGFWPGDTFEPERQQNVWRLFIPAVQISGTTSGLAPLQLPRAHDRQMVDRLPQARIAPGVETAPDGRNRREVLWQHSPLTAAGRNAEHRAGDGAQVGGPRPATAPGWRKERSDDSPFTVRQIARIPQSIPAMLLSSGIVPRHPILHLLDKDGESQPDDIAQQLLNRALRQKCGLMMVGLNSHAAMGTIYVLQTLKKVTSLGRSRRPKFMGEDQLAESENTSGIFGKATWIAIVVALVGWIGAIYFYTQQNRMDDELTQALVQLD